MPINVCRKLEHVFIVYMLAGVFNIHVYFFDTATFI